MSFKDTIDQGLDAVKKGAANVTDAIHEAGHRSAADAEQTKRDVAGDQMTVGQNAGSMLNQASETVKAEVAAAKRDARTNTP
jgi:hypothetical protein